MRTRSGTSWRSWGTPGDTVGRADDSGFDWNAILGNLREGNWKKFREAFYRACFRFVDHDGIDVMVRDWDHLIVLDACRYDAFVDYVSEDDDIDGTVERVTSRGSTTIEWLNRNFTGWYPDIVYITANPQVSPHTGLSRYREEDFNSDNHFPTVIQLDDREEYRDRGVTAPEHVTAEAIDAHEEHPHRRLIVHYMQPHEPFIGSDLGEGVMIKDLRERGCSWDEIRDEYMNNLARVMDAVTELLDALEGRIVITADHGELLGEHGVFRHPHGLYFEELVEVPWMVVERGDRPDIHGSDLSGVDI